MYYSKMSHIFSIFFFVFFLLILPNKILSQRGTWQFLQQNIGISAMHMQLLNNDRVIMFDRADFGRSNISLPFGQCHGSDCTAHSIEYNVLTNTIRPLNLVTDTWCSSGTTLADGLLLQTGGWGAGDRAYRTIDPCPYCDWSEFPNELIERRWYATNHILPNGGAIIIGGIDQFNYEFFPKTELFNLPFLLQTKGKKDQFEENNLYPYVFLNVDGNLFVFANNRAILLDYNTNKVVREYPTIPGGEPRNYPSTGSAVLLPLRNSGSGFEPEVLVCGGTPPGSYELAQKNIKFLQALDTCARIKINDPNPKWVMEKMPMARTMGDMVVLPNGHVAIINGAGYGSAGWECGRNPVLNPVIYNPDSPLGSRFEVMNPTTIPRMYHSTAVLLRDGRILVGGSNPHEYYDFTSEFFPTELSLEAFSPPYLDLSKSGIRPIIIAPVRNTRITYGANINVQFLVYGEINPSTIKITIIRPAFNTHSFSMSQRMVELTNTNSVTRLGRVWFQVDVLAPESANIAPPGYYMLFVVHQDVPSRGVWIQIL